MKRTAVLPLGTRVRTLVDLGAGSTGTLARGRFGTSVPAGASGTVVSPKLAALSPALIAEGWLAVEVGPDLFVPCHESHVAREAAGPLSARGAGAGGGGSILARLSLPLTLSPTLNDPHSVNVLSRNVHSGRGRFSILIDIRALRCFNGMTASLLAVALSARHARDVESAVRAAAAAIARAVNGLPEWETMARRLSESALSREAAERIARATVDAVLPARDPSRSAAESVRRSLRVGGSSASADVRSAVRQAVDVALPASVSLADVLAETALRTPGVRTGDESDPDSLVARRRREALEAILSAAAGPDVRESGLVGSAWGLYHGAAAWLDHGQSYRGTDRERAENRMESTLYGRAAEARDSALAMILEETGVPAARLH